MDLYRHGIGELALKLGLFLHLFAFCAQTRYNPSNILYALDAQFIPLYTQEFCPVSWKDLQNCANKTILNLTFTPYFGGRWVHFGSLTRKELELSDETSTIDVPWPCLPAAGVCPVSLK